MGQQINTQWAGVDLFGDYIYGYKVITVTDSNGLDFQVPDEVIIPFNTSLDENNHVKVGYYGQEYWIPKNSYFPQ
jgi:hypothetical protein